MRIDGFWEALPLTAVNPQMADPPGVDLVADTKKNLENRLTWWLSFPDFGCRDFACSFICHAWKSCHSADTALACFYGFSCCDASLRHEGCCFSVVGLPKLASKHADNREATKGAAIASQQVFCWFWSKIIWMSVNPYLYKNINSIIHYNLGWRIDEVGRSADDSLAIVWPTIHFPTSSLFCWDKILLLIISNL